MQIRRSVIQRIARHELTDLRSNRGFQAALVVTLAVLLMSLAGGWRDYRITKTRIEQMQRDERARWLNQGVKGPHAAADQGIFVFQSIGLAAAFDLGVLPFSGSEHMVVGHHEGLSAAKAAEGTHRLHRFGYLTAAKTLQVVVPLLLVLMFYRAFAGERENGTLRQILSMGVSPAELVCGKLAGLALPAASVLIPIAILGSAALSIAGFAGMQSQDWVRRLLALAALYLIYFGILGSIVLAISARSGNTRRSLAVLLTLWFLACVLLPVIAASGVRFVAPAPTAFEHAVEALQTEEKLPTVEERRAELRARLLKQYRVTSLRDLPVDPIGIELLEEARQVEPLFHAVVARVYDAHARQFLAYQLAGIASPMIAVQSLSMAIAGTDLSARRTFLDAAERYRSSMVHTLNEAIAYNPHYRQSTVFPGTDIIVSLSGNELWSRIRGFDYQVPSLQSMGTNCRASLVYLIAWIAFAAGLLSQSAVRLQVS